MCQHQIMTINCWLKRRTSISRQSYRRETFKVKSVRRWKHWNRVSVTNWRRCCSIRIRTVISIHAPMKTKPFRMTSIRRTRRSSALSHRKHRLANNCLPQTASMPCIRMATGSIHRSPMDNRPITIIRRRHCVSQFGSFRRSTDCDFVFCISAVAPPPKASIPRRSGNNTSASQDLFGSTPFDAPLQPSPFDVSYSIRNRTHSLSTHSSSYDHCSLLIGVHIQ